MDVIIKKRLKDTNDIIKFNKEYISNISNNSNNKILIRLIINLSVVLIGGSFRFILA